jgi:hypothetical protein
MSDQDKAPPAHVASGPTAELAGSVELAEPTRVIAVILRVRRWKLLRLLATSLVLGSPGLFDNEIMLRIGTAFFGFGAIVFAVLLLPGAAWLRLEPAGFTVCHLFRKHFTPWSDVSGFGVAVAGRNELVGYDSRSAAESSPRRAALSTSLSGYNSALPDTYGPRAAELAVLLNEALWRAHRATGPECAAAEDPARASEQDRLPMAGAAPSLPPPEG